MLKVTDAYVVDQIGSSMGISIPVHTLFGNRQTMVCQLIIQCDVLLKFQKCHFVELYVSIEQLLYNM